MRFCALLLSAVIALAQEEVPLFKTGVSLVKVDAEVQDATGMDISGLKASDFVIYDEGQAQTISDLSSEGHPIRILMLLDVSGSMSRHLANLGAKSTEALRALRPNDEVALMNFGTRAEIQQTFTSDMSAIGERIIGSIYKQMLGSETLINDALVKAADYLRQQPSKTRRAIIIVTDNEGARKDISDEATIRALQSADIILSAIVVGQTNGPLTNSRYQNPASRPPDVSRYVAETGGQVANSSTPADALKPLLKQLTTRYTMHYPAPPAEDGAYRKIKVELSPETASRYPGAIIKARSGYTAGQSATAKP